MHLVVCYDVVSNRKRARLQKFLKNYLVRVQKSVFEGDIEEWEYEPMKEGIGKEIDRRLDSVRIFELCRRCAPAMAILGTGNFVVEEEEDLVL